MNAQPALESQIKVLIDNASQKHRSGQLDEAESIYNQILETQTNSVIPGNTFVNLHPKNLYPLVLADFGIVLQKQGKLEAAVNIYRQALRIDPKLAEARHNLSMALNQQGKSAEAIQIFQHVLKLDPTDAQAYNDLGTVLKKQGKFAEAAQAYQQALEFAPNFAVAHSNLGDALKAQGQWTEAIQAYRQALRLDPTLARAHNNLGTVFKAQGNLNEAAQAYQQALKLHPELAEAHSNLGTLFKAQGKLAEAAQAYQRALKLNPNLAQTHYNLGNTFKAQGKSEEASWAYQQVLKLEPSFADAEFTLCMSQLPVVYSSVEAIQESRERYQQHLSNLVRRYHTATPSEQANAAMAVGVSQPYYLAYQGQNDRDLQQSYGELICRLMASRYPQWSTPISPHLLNHGEKIRIGFVSRYFHYHSIWKIPLKGWLENLDRSKFELFGYCTHIKQDAETAIANQILTKFVQGSFSTSQWGEIIQKDQLHVLIFPEFGMDPMTIRLGCLRLAPVQVAFGGHPETSGLPTIDYHLTSDLMEPENAQEHYTETLVRLPNLAVCYSPIDVQPETFTKQDLGLSDNDTMFWCCQSLYKYLPQHDDVFPRIAQEVENCKFIFIKNRGDSSEIVTKTFLKRLNHSFKLFGLDYKDFCILPSRLNRAEFAGITAIADIFLDSIEWSGNNTAMESAAYNLPMVTFPGKMMRGRHVMAILKMMGIHETIASSKDDYIKIAVQLAKDKHYRQQIANKIATNKHKLYGDLAPVKALEKFLLQIVENW